MNTMAHEMTKKNTVHAPPPPPAAASTSSPIIVAQQNATTTTTTTRIASALPANDLDVIQDMIDISADRLEGLRTQCVTSATLTQQEIRSLESKLVRMFSELLLTKARLSERIPASGLPHTTGSELRQWLRVVGLSQDSINVSLTRLSTLEQLLEQNDEELKQILCNNPSYREEEVRRLTKAMQNLRKCREFLSSNNSAAAAAQQPNVAAGCCKEKSTTDSNREQQLFDQLFWDSWDRQQHHHHHHHRGSIGNIGSGTASPRTHRMLAKQAKQQQQQQQQLNSSCRQSPLNNDKTSTTVVGVNDELSSLQSSTLTLTLTPSPPNSPFTPTTMSNFSAMQSSITGGGGSGSLNGTPQRSKTAGTPPPMKKHQTLLNNAFVQPLTPTHNANVILNQQENQATTLPLAKSRSNESQFHGDFGGGGGISLQHQQQLITTSSSSSINTSTIPRSRIHTDPSPDSYSSASSDIIALENNNNPNNLQVPRSPCTPIVTLGMGHTISHRFTKVFKMMSTCDLCQKQMFFGLKCKECKYRCHKDCEPNVPPSCGLPREFVDEFKKTLKDQVGFPPTPLSQTQSIVNSSPNLNHPHKSRVAAAVRRNKSGSTVSSVHPDSSSPGSSCNSSSPSSPALFNLHHQQHIAVAYGTGGSYMTGGNIMSSSGGGSSSTSSNLLSTPSSFHKHSSQFNFPDVTITSNCNQNVAGGGNTTQTLYSSQASGADTISGEYYDASTMRITGEQHSAATMAASLTSANCNNTSLTNSFSSTISSSTVTGSNSHSTTAASVASVVNSGTGTFYPRKLSSAGVDKRGPVFSELSDTHKSNDSDKTVSLSGSTSASTDSDRTPVRLDSTEDGDSGNWPRQNSLSFKEWDIPYGDLHLLEQIGKGRFGTVHRALWHGDVAVKLLKEDYLDDEHMLEAFKLEVANFKKTRHENLVLFMGACMNPPYLAIVTSLCKGNTLYTYIHARRDKFTINKTTLVAQQISQGMGYLHARGIFHKDLRTKNIFLENGKVIITDFGLFSSTKLLYCDIGLGIPSGWLCYLAPELMRALLPQKPTDEILPFSKTSDVFSFGTVWYELLCGEFPFKMQPPESIIWQVGRGMKQTLANLQTSRDVKDILMLCWSFQADDRPEFPKLLTLLERLPKKRLARSPSHPVQLSRSAESVF